MASKSLLQQEIRDITECPICRDTLTDPKVLPCIHTFCLKCLVECGEKMWEYIPGDQIVCPVCSSKCNTTRGGFSDLPNNFFLNKLLIANKVSESIGPQLIYSSSCYLCLAVDNEINAAAYCIDCDQHLCNRCTKRHARQKFEKPHQVVDLEDMPSIEALKITVTYCVQHPKEEIKFYCYDCKIVTCVTCHLTKHGKHECCDINESAEKFLKQLSCDIEQVTQCVQQNEERLQQLQSVHREFLDNLAEIERSISYAYEKVTIDKPETKLFESHLSQLMEELNVLKSKRLKELENEKDELEHQRLIVESFKKYCEEVKEKGTACDISRSANDLHTRSAELVKAQELYNQHQLDRVELAFTCTPSSASLTSASNLIGYIKCRPHGEAFADDDATGETSDDDVTERTVTLAGIPEVLMAKDMLLAVLESSNNDGGKVERIEFDAELPNMAIITFTYKEVAQRLLQEGVFKARKHELRVLPPRDERILYVSDVPESVEDFLPDFLSSKRQGGGDYEDYFFDERIKTATVKFMEKEVARGLLRKQFLELRNCKLRVGKNPPQSPTSVRRTDPEKNVSSSTSNTSLLHDDDDLITPQPDPLITSSSDFITPQADSLVKDDMNLNDVDPLRVARSVVICEVIYADIARDIERVLEDDDLITPQPDIERILEDPKIGGEIEKFCLCADHGEYLVTFVEENAARRLLSHGSFSFKSQSWNAIPATPQHFTRQQGAKEEAINLMFDSYTHPMQFPLCEYSSIDILSNENNVPIRSERLECEKWESAAAVYFKDPQGGIQTPSHWAPMPAGQVYLAVQLQPTNQEYKDVASNFAQPTISIVKIERIQNPSLYRQYKCYKYGMDEAFGTTPSNERRLWHGTAGQNVVNINSCNFNRSFCGMHGVAIGNGVYFAVGSAYFIRGYCPPDPLSGHKYIYQARVLTGKFTHGAAGITRPPVLEGRTGVYYNSVTNSVPSPDMFVVFNNKYAQTYPEYLITFR